MCARLTKDRAKEWPCKGGTVNDRHKKTGSLAGFSGVPGLVGTSWNICMVPRGRLELPLLSKTDFESAASTNSAIRAYGGGV